MLMLTLIRFALTIDMYVKMWIMICQKHIRSGCCIMKDVREWYEQFPYRDPQKSIKQV